MFKYNLLIRQSKTQYFKRGKVIMDIESIQNQLFLKRSEEFLKEFNTKKDEYKQLIFNDLEEFLKEKNAEYIVISPLYSSFITQSYEYRLGVHGQDLYLSNLNKSAYKNTMSGNNELQKMYEYQELK